MKILFYGESPVPETGAARVDRHILDVIVSLGIEVEVLGTSHFWEDDYDHARYPYKITHINGMNTLETHQAAGKAIDERDGTFDLLFISADMHVPNILMEHVKKYPSIVLGAIDGEVKHRDQVISLESATVPVVYSKFSHSQVLKHLDIASKFRCITLGCEPDTFYPLSYVERRAYRLKAFGIDNDDRFLVMWANRNQMRKDPARAMQAFHLFHQRVPNSLLYMHARMQDVGGNLASQALLLGLQVSGRNPEVIFSPPEYTEIAGFDREKLNKMYNAADCGISTAQGEGWGLTTSEFMSAGRPFIGPRNTTFFELLGENEERGYLARSGGPNLWSIYYGNDDAPRPLASATDMADKLYYVWSHREEAAGKARAAREWAEQHTWEQFKDEWKALLCQVRSSLVSLERSIS